MKNIFNCVVGLILSTNVIHAQLPTIYWDNTIGSRDGDYLYAIDVAEDGNIFIGGESGGAAYGDKAEDQVGGLLVYGDAWVLKLNPAGNILWQNSIGGLSSDDVDCIEATPDGGCIVGCSSGSLIGGDKTENCFLTPGGVHTKDYWVVKLNSTGDIEWQNTIGGTGDDYIQAIRQTPDGGYILGGYSFSKISGDKTEFNIGGSSYWIVKIDAVGNIMWQNTIDGVNEDKLTSLDLTADGGYILGGYSKSGISGEKTEACFNNSFDYWIIKVSATGNPEWQNTIGGNNDDAVTSIRQTMDGGYIVAGTSKSNVTGDKTSPCRGMDDFWVIKLNTSGAITWQKTIGGTQTDASCQIREKPDGGYFLAGYSTSGIGAEKTVDYIGYSDFWLLELDAIGNITWQNVYGGLSYENFASLELMQDGGVIMGGNSNSDISGNKTENAFEYYDGTNRDDYWVIRLAGDSCVPSTEVCNDYDDDCDGNIDEGAAPGISIEATNTTTFCEGGYVPLYATYTGNGTLQWKRNGNNITGAHYAVYKATTKGTYSCRITTDCGSAISSDIVVTVPKNPTAAITAGGPVVFCAGSNVVLTANTGAGLSYQWYKNDILIAAATAINYTASTPGTYTCKVTKTASGCSTISNPVLVTVPCKEFEELNSTEAFVIFPNPTNGYVTIQSNLPVIDDQLPQIIITNSLGQIVYNEVSNFKQLENTQIINLIAFPNGVYQISILNGSYYNTKTIIKQ